MIRIEIETTVLMLKTTGSSPYPDHLAVRTPSQDD
jgi:hypothetical protein